MVEMDGNSMLELDLVVSLEVRSLTNFKVALGIIVGWEKSIVCSAKVLLSSMRL